MEQERIEQLLNELAQRTAEPVRPGLADEIKARIPDKPARHKSGLDTIRIIIDLRVTKLAAAAAIIITLLLCVTLLGGKDPAGSSFLQNTKDTCPVLSHERHRQPVSILRQSSKKR